VALAGIWVVNVVYDRLDVLMLSKLGPAADVAVYSVAYTAIRLTWLVPSLVTGAFFPLLTALLRENPREARASFFLLSRIFVFIGMPLSAALALGGTDLMTLLFGDRYERAGGVVAILAWTALMTFQTYLLWYGVLACHKERLVLYLQLAGLLLNAGANAVLIPRFGTQGAAIALVLSELWAVGAQAYVVHRYLFRFPLAQLLTKPLIATVLLAPVIVAASFVSSLGAAAVAAVTVPSLLLALGYVSRDEWEPLLGPLRGVARRLSRSAA
jgi:O-antigen/teichoic acid export membrane protein